jgi:flagellar basal body-associated protein FliL
VLLVVVVVVAAAAVVVVTLWFFNVHSGYRGPLCATGCRNVNDPDVAPDSSCKVANDCHMCSG